MISRFLLPVLLLLSLVAFFAGRSRACHVAKRCGGVRSLHSLPVHYGVLTAICCLLPGLFISAIWMICEDPFVTGLVTANLPENIRALPHDQFNLVMNEIRNIALGGFAGGVNAPGLQEAAGLMAGYLSKSRRLLAIIAPGGALLGGAYVTARIRTTLRARIINEAIAKGFLACCAAVVVLTATAIVLSLIFEALRFFRAIPVTDFLFGQNWSPQTMSSGGFGAIPLFTGTLLITLIAMLVAIPSGLLSAIYLSEYASRRVRAWAKPALELLAGIPTVVFGFVGALTVAPMIRQFGLATGLPVSAESALAAGLVMGVMIIPYISSLTGDVIRAVPQSLRDGSLGLGATRFETIRHVVIPAAMPGIAASVLLAVSRAIGETMIVLMAAGLAADLTFNPLKAVTTVTAQIVQLLIGDQELDTPRTLAPFALGLVLFVFTLLLNYGALLVVKRYREQYE